MNQNRCEDYSRVYDADRNMLRLWPPLGCWLHSNCFNCVYTDCLLQDCEVITGRQRRGSGGWAMREILRFIEANLY
jgi:hypothetical protein